VIRRCEASDAQAILAIINDGAQAYQGVIPPDRYKVPYMTADELRHEIDEGVAFWADDQDRALVGVMGLQDVADVTLIRHAYVRTAFQHRGIGGALLAILQARASHPVLVGTWAAATWAILFYERHGFRLVPPQDKDALLRTYWSVPPRQIETSVVLADPRWFARGQRPGPAGRQPEAP
jgi:N-acetylglutamate synthase-like GNAT family acetyltransferase